MKGSCKGEPATSIVGIGTGKLIVVCETVHKSKAKDGSKTGSAPSEENLKKISCEPSLTYAEKLSLTPRGSADKDKPKIVHEESPSDKWPASHDYPGLTESGNPPLYTCHPAAVE